MTQTQEHAARAGSPGEPFGPYEVYERLGVGGMATVHRAIERGIEGFERVVALKRLLPHLAEDEEFVRSFVREAKLASQLQHINICQLYELGRVGSVYFISMEHIEGSDVRQILRQSRRQCGPPPIQVTVSILAELCDALDYAHNCTDGSGEPLGLVHRDVSPSNLLLASSGHLKIIDFGIAKATSHKLRTQTGRVKGKLAYMSPEAIRGGELDARSDIFSVGVIAHELLTATPLFASKNDYETLTQIQQRVVEPPSAKNAEVPEDLDRVVLKLLAKNPDERFPSAGEVRDALEEVRLRHQLNATNRSVRAWIDEAFAEGVAQPGRSRRPSASNSNPSVPRPSSASPVGGSGGGASPMEDAVREHAEGLAREPASPESYAAAGEVGAAAGEVAAAAGEVAAAAGEVAAADESGPASAPNLGAAIAGSAEEDEEGALTVADSAPRGGGGEEEAADIAWGEDAGAPVILDEVPDVSERRELTAATPPPPPPAEPGDLDERGPSEHGAAAVVAQGGEASARAFAPTAGRSAQQPASAPEESLDLEPPSVAGVAPETGDRERVQALGENGAPEVSQPAAWPEGTRSAPMPDDSGAEPDRRAESEPAASRVQGRSPQARPPRSSAPIGTTIVAREPGMKKGLAIAAAGVGAAGIALASFLLLGSEDEVDDASARAGAEDGAAGEEDEGGAAAATTAELTFAIHPSNVEVRLDDEPLEVSGMPHRMEIEPGAYRVQVEKDGYESWVESIEVEAGQSHVIHEQLEEGGSDTAVLKVESTPSGLEAWLDGEPVEEQTPLELEIEPGERELEVEGPGGEWSETFEAAEDTVYAFHPVLDEDEDDQPSRRASARRASAETQRGDPAPESRGATPSEEDEADASLSPQFDVGSADTSLTPVPSGDVDAPPSVDEQGDEGPERVTSADMVRLSGAQPAIPSRASSRVSEATVELCVSAEGAVTSVDVLSSPGVKIQRALRRDLRTWRFRPYEGEDGEPRPVCFEHEVYLDS